MKRIITIFIASLVLLVGCVAEDKPEILIEEAAEETVGEFGYSILDGRISDGTGKEITAQFRFLGPDTCEVGEDVNAFNDYKEFDNGEYLASRYAACLCQSHCAIKDLYLFDLGSKRYIDISRVDPEVGEAISRCNVGGECYFYQIKEIKDDVMTLNIFADDPENEGEFVYPCSPFLGLDSSISEVERVCGLKLEKEMKIENINELF